MACDGETKGTLLFLNLEVQCTGIRREAAAGTVLGKKEARVRVLTHTFGKNDRPRPAHRRNIFLLQPCQALSLTCPSRRIFVT